MNVECFSQRVPKAVLSIPQPFSLQNQPCRIEHRGMLGAGEIECSTGVETPVEIGH